MPLRESISDNFFKDDIDFTQPKKRVIKNIRPAPIFQKDSSSKKQINYDTNPRNSPEKDKTLQANNNEGNNINICAATSNFTHCKEKLHVTSKELNQIIQGERWALDSEKAAILRDSPLKFQSS